MSKYLTSPLYSHLPCNASYTSSNSSNTFHNNITYRGHRGLTWSEAIEALEEYEPPKPQKANKEDKITALLFFLLFPLIVIGVPYFCATYF